MGPASRQDAVVLPSAKGGCRANRGLGAVVQVGAYPLDRAGTTATIGSAVRVRVRSRSRRAARVQEVLPVSKRHARAFTLIELLVVIAIIAILAGILFPVFAKAREKAYTADCTSNVHQLVMAFKMYLGDWDQKFPSAGQGWNMPMGSDWVKPVPGGSEDPDIDGDESSAPGPAGVLAGNMSTEL
ncbi:MAG: prepilin-type N-terminal cleavage/methylation domain-containing protein, partial [Armatimonadetes bacterium]|nr:prepilin-type N-terminal cleavage/methylation domain-containing protein [Armatimonadota bacterium]